jgi:hypothetical protein
MSWQRSRRAREHNNGFDLELGTWNLELLYSGLSGPSNKFPYKIKMDFRFRGNDNIKELI